MLKPLLAVVTACLLCAPLVLHAHGDEAPDHDSDPSPTPAAPVAANGQLHVSAELGQALGIRTAVVAANHPVVPQMARIIGDPTRTRRVPAPYAGRLVAPEDGFPRPGAQVKKGQVLAVLAPTVTPAEEGQLRVAIAIAKRENVVSGIKLKTFKEGYSGRILNEDQNPTLLPKIEAEVAGTKRRIAAGREGLLRRRAIRAPRDGVVDNSVLVPGAVVAGGQKLVDLLDPDALWIEVYGDTDTLPKHVIGVTDDGRLLKLDRQGTSPELVAGSPLSIYRVVGAPANLRPGERLALRLFASDELKQPLPVPAAALGNVHDGHARVWVQVGVQQYRARSVKVAAAGKGGWQVTAGLLPGECVVVAGLAPPTDKN